MTIQEYVSGEEIKKLIDDKLINSNSFKDIIRRRGIFPVCRRTDELSTLVSAIFFGSGVMTEIHQTMNFEQNNLKSTIVVINPKLTDTDEDFITEISNQFIKYQRVPLSRYELKDVCHKNDALSLSYCYEKTQKGRLRLADTKEVTLDVRITPLPDGKYKVNIRHDGISDSKQFISFLERMNQQSEEDQIFSIKRLTLASLQKAHKVDFFDDFASYKHNNWKLVDITNVTVNKDEVSIDNDEEIAGQVEENMPTGALSGISSAVLTGERLRNNDFVKECMGQNFVFSSMRYKFDHKSQPISIELDITFRQIDLKINIVRTWCKEEDGKSQICLLSTTDQDEYLDYFQNIAYDSYSKLLTKQREEAEKTQGLNDSALLEVK